MLDSPAVSSFGSAFQRSHREPKDGAAHGIFVRNDLSIVMAYRLARPTDALWFLRQVHIQQRQRFVWHQEIEHFGDIRLQRRKIWLAIVTHVCAKRDASRSEQGSLFRRGQRAGMPE